MEEIYSDSGSGKAQPVVAALRSAVAERKLSKELLLRYEIDMVRLHTPIGYSDSFFLPKKDLFILKVIGERDIGFPSIVSHCNQYGLNI